MGSISRANRAERFIKEFGHQAEELVSLLPGEQITYLKTALAQEESGLEQVFAWVHFENARGERLVFATDVAVFDPENDRGEDLVERLVDLFEQPEDIIRQRLREADLL